jgi:hypothetical protein
LASAEIVANLRAELNEAMQASVDEDLLFELGPVELELTVGVDKAAKPGAKVKVGVLELGAETKLGSSKAGSADDLGTRSPARAVATLGAGLTRRAADQHDTANSPRPATNTRRRPSTSATRPPSSIRPPKVMA